MTQRTPPKSEVQADFFAATLVDLAVRDQRDLMERPFFSLSKKPRARHIDYQVADTWIRVSPNPEFGMATIWDADVLIFAATQITEALDRGLQPSRVLHFHPYNLLKSIRRGTSGREYELLRSSFRRLAATYVETNIRAAGKKKTVGFHWLEEWSEQVDEVTGQTLGMTLTLPQWFYDGVVQRGGVLTVHEDYFLLTGGLERWLYRVARKHGGNQPLGWHFTMRQLFDKSGSMARFSDFACDIRRIVKANALPDYSLSRHTNNADEEIVYFVRRDRLPFDDPNYTYPRNPRRRMVPATPGRERR